MSEPKSYHVALSFAGEDRVYVEAVATALSAEGVEVFYGKFEESKLWGKNLYDYLSDVYRNRARFTVMFISPAYKDKLWNNHERENAQARAFAESGEYILPAFFDDTVEVPGLSRTTGHILLTNRSPEQLATLIIQKLQDDGVVLNQIFSYSDEAKADVDFPLSSKNGVADLIKAMRSLNYYTQNPAIDNIFKLSWDQVSPDEAFVLGRNLYQSACGGAKRAIFVLENLRRKLAELETSRSLDMLNGMFFEVYFDSRNAYRGANLKDDRLADLLAMRDAKKFTPSIRFITDSLKRHGASLPPP